MDGKRKNFSEADDNLLLKQVLAVKPFQGKHGTVMTQWEVVAKALMASPDFSRDNLGAKTAQIRFNLLLDGDRAKNREAKAKSGVEEAYTEKDQLLDDAPSEVDDWKHRRTVEKDANVAQAVANEKAGEVVRQLAVERLKRRAADASLADASPGKVAKFDKIARVLAEHKDKELAFRREQWQAEQRLREETERARREESVRMLQLLELLAKK